MRSLFRNIRQKTRPNGALQKNRPFETLYLLWAITPINFPTPRRHTWWANPIGLNKNLNY